MSQFGIREILEKHPIVPVATIKDLGEVDTMIEGLLKQGIHCIEVTLRTAIAFDAMRYIKKHYSNEMEVGVGTVVAKHQLMEVADIGVDFIVSPGLLTHLEEDLNKVKIPFIPGVVTPSEIMQGMAVGYDTFKLFPAEIVGGVKLLKTYAGLFPNAKFCPTGGVNQANYPDYAALKNVICVGGSWVV